MTSSRVVLTDTDSGVWLDSWQTDASNGPQLSGGSHWSISKKTLRGGLADGVDVVTLDSGELSISVLPTRGMGLWRGVCRGIPIEWRSPVIWPVHPRHVAMTERGGLGWLYGFNELLCRCGLSFNGPPGNDNGTEITLHGRIANLPAHHVSAEVSDHGPGVLSVTGVIDEAGMFSPALRMTSTVRTLVGSTAITIHDRVINFGGQPTEVELLYHTNLGRPFMEDGAKFVAPVAEVAPRDEHSARGLDRYDLYPGPVAGIPEEAFFFALQGDATGQTTVLLKNAAGDKGFSMKWSLAELPCFTLWKNPAADADGYVTGLEPGTNYPNFRSFERERGRVIKLAPGQSIDTALTIEIHDSANAVRQVEEHIRSLQKSDPVRFAGPHAKYSAIDG